MRRPMKSAILHTESLVGYRLIDMHVNLVLVLTLAHDKEVELPGMCKIARDNIKYFGCMSKMFSFTKHETL